MSSSYHAGTINGVPIYSHEIGFNDDEITIL